MKEDLVEYFYGNKIEVEKEQQRKRELMSYFPKMLGTVDKTKYVLWDDDKPKLSNCFGGRIVETSFPVDTLKECGEFKVRNGNSKIGIPGFENNGKNIGFDNKKECAVSFGAKTGPVERLVLKSPFDYNYSAIDEKINLNTQQPAIVSVGLSKPRLTRAVSDSLDLEGLNVENRLDTVSYNDKGHILVAFKNDVIGTEGFKAFDPTDRAGCKRRCMEMLAYSGCELSGKRIDMTVNDEKGRAMRQSDDFQRGINAIDNALEKKQAVILNVDYKDGTADSADRAGDHFIIIVGRSIIDGVAYYHFYDPATQFVDFGTANTNVLYIKDGFLQGCFIKRNGGINRYKVTSVRLNK